MAGPHTTHDLQIEQRLTRLETSIESLSADVRSLTTLARSDRKFMKWVVAVLAAAFGGGAAIMPKGGASASEIAGALAQYAKDHDDDSAEALRRVKAWEAFHRGKGPMPTADGN